MVEKGGEEGGEGREGHGWKSTAVGRSLNLLVNKACLAHMTGSTEHSVAGTHDEACWPWAVKSTLALWVQRVVFHQENQNQLCRSWFTFVDRIDHIFVCDPVVAVLLLLPVFSIAWLSPLCPGHRGFVN